MKTHILYIGLALAVLVLGLLAGSHLPAGIETQPVQTQPMVVPGPLAPSPLPSQPPKLRATLPGNNAVVFTADGKTLASVYMVRDGNGFKCEVKLWDVPTAKERAAFKLGSAEAPCSWPLSLALAPDGKMLAAAYQWDAYDNGPHSAVKVWDVLSLKEQAVIRDATFEVKSVAFSADGKTLALAGAKPSTILGTTGVIKLWDAGTGKDRALLTPLIGVRHVAFSPDGKVLASVSDGGQIRPMEGYGAVTLWDVTEGKERDAFPASAGSFTFAAFTPDGKTVAAAGLEGCGIVRLWDVVTGQELATLKAHQGKNPVTALAITADGKTLALG